MALRDWATVWGRSGGLARAMVLVCGVDSRDVGVVTGRVDPGLLWRGPKVFTRDNVFTDREDIIADNVAPATAHVGPTPVRFTAAGSDSRYRSPSRLDRRDRA